jgi:hypothetical protein
MLFIFTGTSGLILLNNSLNRLESSLKDLDIGPYDAFFPVLFQMLLIFDSDCLLLFIFGWYVSPFIAYFIIYVDLNYFVF